MFDHYRRMSQSRQFPEVPKALLEELEKRFPDRVPEITSSLEDIYRKQGEATVIRLLRNQFNQQTKGVLLKTS